MKRIPVSCANPLVFICLSATLQPGRTGNRAFLPFLSDLALGRPRNRAFLPILSDLALGRTGNRAFLPFLSDLALGRPRNRAFLPILSDLALGRTGNRAFLPILSDLAPGRTGNRAFLPILSDLAGECVCQNGCAANDKTKTQQANTKAISLCAKWTGGVRQSDTPFILSRTRNRLLKILAYFGPAQKLQ